MKSASKRGSSRRRVNGEAEAGSCGGGAGRRTASIVLSKPSSLASEAGLSGMTAASCVAMWVLKHDIEQLQTRNLAS